MLNEDLFDYNKITCDSHPQLQLSLSRLDVIFLNINTYVITCYLTYTHVMADFFALTAMSTITNNKIYVPAFQQLRKE